MSMLWKCIVSASNHCEVYRQRWSTQDILNAIIYSAGRGRPWTTGTGECSNSIESVTQTSRKFALAWQLGTLGLLMFAFAGAVLQPTSPSRYHPLRQAARCDEICDVIYWRLLAAAASECERWAIWKSNFKNRFLENFINNINITILFNYQYVRYFLSASGNPAACGLLFESSVCWSTHGGISLTFLHIQIRERTTRARTDTIRLFQYTQRPILIPIRVLLVLLCPSHL